MIGYYVHHVGRGHLHRARAIAAECSVPVVGLSSLDRPPGWSGGWVTLSRDDEADAPRDVSAGGRLHWAPAGDPGLLDRMAALSAWMAEARPGLVVSDVSVEVAVLARLHGVAVASFVLPGRRDDDPHRLGFGVSSVLLAAWPTGVPGMVSGLPDDIEARMRHVGGLSRFAATPPPVQRRAGPWRVAVMLGRGGGSPGTAVLDAARAQAPDWEWTVLGGPSAWAEDPFPVLRDADVVICQAGQNSVAEVAAAQRPALVIPAERPHAEQVTTAAALASGDWPIEVAAAFPVDGWPGRLHRLRALDGRGWRGWCDGRAATRAAEVLQAEHDRAGSGALG
ncbi:MAG: glycosyltransferase [Nocardioides sp.]